MVQVFFPPVFSAWLKDLDVRGGFPYCGIGVPGDLGEKMEEPFFFKDFHGELIWFNGIRWGTLVF